MEAQRLILLVEDEPVMRSLLRMVLEGNGYLCLEAATGPEGLSLAAEHRPDAILLDLDLPGVEGLDLLSRLREWSRVPVLVISGRGREVEKVAALDFGADDYILKPLQASELLARLRAALRRAPPRAPRMLPPGLP
jgi:two-component system KDP operon response regulator KdpE